MEMYIQLKCQGCVGHVFRAIGEFISQDDEMATIDAVEVTEEEDEEEEGRVWMGVAISWDACPTPSQVALFREVWDEESGFPGIVVFHHGASLLVSEPIDRSHELN